MILTGLLVMDILASRLITLTTGAFMVTNRELAFYNMLKTTHGTDTFSAAGYDTGCMLAVSAALIDTGKHDNAGNRLLKLK